MKHFTGSWIATGLGLILAAVLGYVYNGTMSGIFSTLFLVLVLAILEISISFDNAVVNATVLKKMTPLWQHRFLTWGIAIAVFGMRLVFPVMIVSVLGKLSPWNALVVAATDPVEYARIMTSVHHEMSAFGGSFLLLVALKYFFDVNKDQHWIHMIEAPLVKMGRLEAIEVGLALLFVYILSRFVPESEVLAFLGAGIAGILTYIFVEGIGTFLQVDESNGMSLEKASIGMFLYLEVLDASFSFDGVIGAFAVTNNIFLIAIGLGIGAFFVRSLTVYLVEEGTLQKFKYLEHGAFYAVWALAIIMFSNVFIEVPEIVTGGLSAGLIGLSLYSSRRDIE